MRERTMGPHNEARRWGGTGCQAAHRADGAAWEQARRERLRGNGMFGRIGI